MVYFLCKFDSPEELWAAAKGSSIAETRTDASGAIQLSLEHSEAHFATMDEIEVLVPHENLKSVFQKALQWVAKNHCRPPQAEKGDKDGTKNERT